ncbi:hypothetical protein D9619_011841 [Psilocybe cf. subviscida]|uniref:PARP catalytic domain-containing protein n=1 Tax=Psilocybe cf. subviscida TaxID=2480587 RepID=A0A8H5EW88_9AGAR|nr:hypothetical protein D9619_011841 [Psilocybe cf. subviscida]
MSLLATHLDNNQIQDSYDDFDDDEGNFNSYYQDDLEEEDDDDGLGGLTGQDLCIVCEARPAYSKNGKSYPTCGLTCAKVLEQAQAEMLQQALSNARAPQVNRRSNSASVPIPRAPARTASSGQARVDGLVNNMANLSFQRRGTDNSGSASARNPSTTQRAPTTNRLPRGGNTSTRGRTTGATTTTTTAPNTVRRQAIVTFQLCVVCVAKPCHDAQFVTCGLKCAEKLVTSGPHDKTMCDYCHRRPRVTGKNQCGATCAEKAKLACLLCKARPKLNRYHLCGRSCKQIATKSTPLILEAPAGHITYEQVEKKFLSAWKYPGTAIPTIKKIYKIIENKSFLQPYDAYKKAHGNKEVFRYHGTSKKCSLGAAGNTTLCNIAGCALCSILRTSFKVSLANPAGAFGAGVYSSSASNKAYSYSGGGTGAMILTKVILGNPYNVTGWNQVMSCPAGYNSVVFDRQNGSLNETIVYTDDAIRPVFLIIF